MLSEIAGYQLLIKLSKKNISRFTANKKLWAEKSGNTTDPKAFGLGAGF
jgi:hypothetical protein